MDSSSSNASTKVKPITWRNLPGLARRTARADKSRYFSKKRAMTLGRLRYMLAPNLQNPIFIIGAARSGTTFLGDCLAELPELSYHFEPVATKAAARYVYEGQWGKVKASIFYRGVYAWLMRIHGDGDLRFAEKTPRNSMIIPFLNDVFPNAQFVHIIRDGRDAALSHSKKPWLQASQSNSGMAEPGGYSFGPYAQFWVEPERAQEFEQTSDIHRCIWAWVRLTEAALAASADLPAPRYHELRYESLVSNPAREADQLLDFLQIHNSESRQILHDAVARAKPDSVGQWKNQLSDSQLQQIDLEAGWLLRQLGYSS